MKPVIALVLVASLALAGCGAAPTLAPAAAKGKAPMSGPSVRVIAGGNGGGLISPGTSRVNERPNTAFTLKTLTPVAFTEQEMLEEAETAGYSLQSYAKQVEKFSRVGHVRKTADGKTLLESVDGIFKKTTTVYTLTGTPEILSELATRQNKKSWVRGMVDPTNVVTVEKVSAMVDFGFLTNWITKGRVVGTVLDANKRPVSGVSIKLTRLSDKVLFAAQSETDGSFKVKNLVPGDYTAEFSKAGLPPASIKVTVEKRKSSPIEAGIH